MSKISIIMPSLNVGNYIEKSLKSVMKQTLSDIEIICIDAGSVDGTLEIIERMAKAGVAVNVHYKPLPMMTAYRKMGFDIRDYPNSYKRFANEITLPLHTKLTDEEVEYVIESYGRIVREYL